MPLPGITQTLVDGALGLDASATDLHVKVGVASKGAANTVYTFTDPKTLVDTLGVGPLVEAGAFHLDNAKRPVMCVPVEATTDGALGTITKTGSGPDVTDNSSAPNDAYQLRLRITVAGAIGTSRAIYSLDGGRTWSPEIATSATLAIPGTGISLTFAVGSYVVGDEYAADCTAPSYDASAATAAIQAALDDGTAFRCVHLVGAPATPADAATLIAAVETLMQSAEAAFRYVYTVIELPADTDANIKTALASVVAPRVIVVADSSDEPSSAVRGRMYKRPAAWPVVARVMSVPLHEHPGRFARGPLSGVSAIYRDEAKTPGLDAARVTTLRTFVGETGFYVTRGNTLAAVGSDFASVMNRQVMDRALDVAYHAMLRYLNESLVVKADGTIDDAEAAAMEASVLGKLRRELLGTNGYASDVTFQIVRTNNVLSTKTLRYKVRVLPKGYAEFIEGEVGFSAPQTATAA